MDVTSMRLPKVFPHQFGNKQCLSEIRTNKYWEVNAVFMSAKKGVQENPINSANQSKLEGSLAGILAGT